MLLPGLKGDQWMEDVPQPSAASEDEWMGVGNKTVCGMPEEISLSIYIGGWAYNLKESWLSDLQHTSF